MLLRVGLYFVNQRRPTHTKKLFTISWLQKFIIRKILMSFRKNVQQVKFTAQDFFFLLFPIVALTPCSPIDGATRIYLLFLYILESLDHDYVSGSIFPTTLDREGEKSSEYCNSTQICRWWESNPGRQHSKRERYPLHHCLPVGPVLFGSKQA